MIQKTLDWKTESVTAQKQLFPEIQVNIQVISLFSKM